MFKIYLFIFILSITVSSGSEETTTESKTTSKEEKIKLNANLACEIEIIKHLRICQNDFVQILSSSRFGGTVNDIIAGNVKINSFHPKDLKLICCGFWAWFSCTNNYDDITSQCKSYKTRVENESNKALQNQDFINTCSKEFSRESHSCKDIVKNRR